MRSRILFAVFGLALGLASVVSAETKEEFLRSLSATPAPAPVPAPIKSTCVDNAFCTSNVQCMGGKIIGACINNHCICP
jgi:hypothetical protein